MTFQETKKLHKYFNGTIIWTSFVLSFPVWSVTFCLYLNEVVSGSSGASILALLLSINGSSLYHNF